MPDCHSVLTGGYFCQCFEICLIKTIIGANDHPDLLCQKVCINTVVNEISFLTVFFNTLWTGGSSISTNLDVSFEIRKGFSQSLPPISFFCRLPLKTIPAWKFGSFISKRRDGNLL